MTDEQAAKLRAQAERTMDRIWPMWREALDSNARATALEMHETIKAAVQYGFDTAERSADVAIEEAVQARIRVVAEHTAAQFEAVKKAAVDHANAMIATRLRTDLENLRSLTEKVRQKHGDISLPVLLLRLVELQFIGGNGR